jgi:hypothetical protein
MYMPVIFYLNAFMILIRTRDHNPPHVHCKAGDIEALILIETQEVIRNHGVRPKDLKRLQAFVKHNSDVLLNEWRHYHEED